MQLLIEPITWVYLKNGYVTIAHLKSIWKRKPIRIFKKIKFVFLLKINFLYVSDRFNALILKIIF
jgi:hypothetical protein